MALIYALRSTKTCFNFFSLGEEMKDEDVELNFQKRFGKNFIFPIKNDFNP